MVINKRILLSATDGKAFAGGINRVKQKAAHIFVGKPSVWAYNFMQ